MPGFNEHTDQSPKEFSFSYLEYSIMSTTYCVLFPIPVYYFSVRYEILAFDRELLSKSKYNDTNKVKRWHTYDLTLPLTKPTTQTNKYN